MITAVFDREINCRRAASVSIFIGESCKVYAYLIIRLLFKRTSGVRYSILYRYHCRLIFDYRAFFRMG